MRFSTPLLPDGVSYSADERITQDDPYYLEKMHIRFPEDMTFLYRLAIKYKKLAFLPVSDKQQIIESLIKTIYFYDKLRPLSPEHVNESDYRRLVDIKNHLFHKKTTKSKGEPYKWLILIPLFLLLLLLAFVLVHLSSSESEVTKSYPKQYAVVTQYNANIYSPIISQDSAFEEKTSPEKLTGTTVLDNRLPLNMLRTAILGYTVDKGKLPGSLTDLTDSYPNNYLSFIPLDELHSTNKEVSVKDNTGGWVYTPYLLETPIKDLKPNQLYSLLAEILVPNNNSCRNSCPSEPINIEINKAHHSLTLKMGDIKMKTYEAGLGKNNSTPEGSFTIEKRVVNPNHHLSKKPYGTRGLELSNRDYAIHGTYDTSSIGKNESKGCIRLLNEDIEEIFSIVPLGSAVTIVNKPADQTGTATKPISITAKQDVMDELLLNNLIAHNLYRNQANKTASDEIDRRSTFSWNN
ncbi:L,D-transpeptidase [Peribacillus saganii]|uniref:L,D-transpeptidase n=1 Tax=Peribacillus saganii TaxID=2303992 RepID=A0A372LP75_9BACI|nr:L,D-transpeptidase [Peribacillus saganii]RFU69544.1 L,D-transpeptidase [Peribacillus saganii]